MGGGGGGRGGGGGDCCCFNVGNSMMVPLILVETLHFLVHSFLRHNR